MLVGKAWRSPATLRLTNIAMENGPFEDVFPIQNGIFHYYVSLPKGTWLVRLIYKPCWHFLRPFGKGITPVRGLLI